MLLLLLVVGCTASPAPIPEGPRQARAIKDVGRELATSYEVVVYTDRDEARVRADLAAAREVCRQLERVFSEWQPDSDVSRLNRDGVLADPHPNLRTLIEASLKVSRATGGAFDVTWFALAEVWNAAAERGTPPTDEELAAALERVGPEHVHVEEGAIRLDPGTRLGLGAVAKGWIVDVVFAALVRRGYPNAIVNIGGDLRAGGARPDGSPHPVTITDPFDRERSAAVLRVNDRSVATSGNYARRRQIGDELYGHLLDPRSGRPATFEGSVTVLTRDAAMADALATALFVLGPDEGLALAERTAGVDAVFVTRDGVRSTLEK